MSDRPRQFARYPWFVEHGIELVHPEDLAALKALMPYGRVFGFARAGEWIELDDGTRRYRVRDSLLKPLAPPRFWVGDEVGIQSGGERRRGVVRDVRWHGKNEAPMYFLRADGKALSKRYFDPDLSA